MGKLTTQKCILLLLDNAYKPDPRVEKEINTLTEELNLHVLLVCTRFSNKNEILNVNPRFTIYRILNQNRINKFYKYSLKEEVNSILDIIKKNNINVIHAHDHISLQLAIKLLKKVKVKLIYDAHEYISGWYYYKYERNVVNKFKGSLVQKIYSIVEKKNLKNVDELITVSNSLGDLYKKKKKFDKNSS